MRGSHHRRNADIRRRASHDRGDVAKIGGIDGDNAAGTSASGEFVPTPFPEAIDISDLVKRQRRLRRSMWGLRLLSALLLVLALCVIGYPMVLQYQSDVRLAHTTSAAAERVAGWPYPQDEEYQSLLDAGGGVMGAIRIPEISVDLPIYHVTSESALASGAGHLYGSSLPVGGESTHSVITGHRGMVEAMMFTRLDEMKVGDYFYIDVMGETLGYRVDRIEVIEPDDTSRLKIVEGEDRVTLMTCTPYGVNTHRLLVSGVRAAIPGDIPPIEEVPHDPRVATAIAVSGTLLPLLLLVAFLRRGPWNPMRHGTRWPKHW